MVLETSHLEATLNTKTMLLLPNTVEDIPVGENSDVDVWNEDVVEATLLLVPEEGVRHPDLLGIGHREVLDLG